MIGSGPMKIGDLINFCGSSQDTITTGIIRSTGNSDPFSVIVCKRERTEKKKKKR